MGTMLLVSERMEHKELATGQRMKRLGRMDTGQHLLPEGTTMARRRRYPGLLLHLLLVGLAPFFTD